MNIVNKDDVNNVIQLTQIDNNKDQENAEEIDNNKDPKDTHEMIDNNGVLKKSLFGTLMMKKDETALAEVDLENLINQEIEEEKKQAETAKVHDNIKKLMEQLMSRREDKVHLNEEQFKTIKQEGVIQDNQVEVEGKD